jgi:hypothetical protein
MDPRAHFVKYHKRKYPSDMNATIASDLGEHQLVYPPIRPLSPVQPVYGLAPPKPGYHICNDCHRGFKGDGPSNGSSTASRSFKKHKCIDNDKTTLERTFTIGSVQTFGPGPHGQRSWFPVLATIPAPSPKNPWTTYQAQIAARPKPELKISVPENYRVTHQFLHRQGWVQHLEGKSPSILQTLVNIKTKDSLLPGLASHIAAFLFHHQKALGDRYTLRRLISTRPRYGACL